MYTNNICRHKYFDGSDWRGYLQGFHELYYVNVKTELSKKPRHLKVIFIYYATWRPHILLIMQVC